MKDEITLYNSSGIEHIDSILKGTIGLYELIFTNRILGYYLLGSYGNGSAVPGSDLDILIVFKKEIKEKEEALVRRVNSCCSSLSPLRLDIAPRSEGQIIRDGSTSLKLASVFLYGKDIRTRIPDEPFDRWLLDAVTGSFTYIRILRGSPEFLFYPLAYPDPNGEFFGYERYGIYTKQGMEKGVRTLLNTATLMATTLVGIKARKYVASKRQAIDLYKQWFHDEWAIFLDELFTNGRDRWFYLTPEAAAEREYLRFVCQKFLSFENLFLTQCFAFLMDEIQHGSDQIMFKCLCRFGEIVNPDEPVIQLCYSFLKDESPEVRQAAKVILERLQNR